MQNRRFVPGFSMNRSSHRHSWKLLAAGLALAFGGAASAHHAPGHGDDHHHHGHKAGHVHQHGLASLSIAQQDDTLTVVFDSPLDSLIGFETKPANAEQQALADKLLAQLRDASQVVKLPAAAQCMQQEPVITAPTLIASQGMAAEDDETDEDKDEDGAHEHGHDADHDHDHDGDAHHDGDDHHHGAHADLNATYTFTCKHPAAFKSLTVSALRNWPRIKDVDVAVLSNQGQAAARVQAAKPEVSW